MPDPATGPQLKFKDLQKDLDAFNAEFDKKLKAMKLEPRATLDAKKNLMMSQKQMMNFIKKTYKTDTNPAKELKPIADKQCKSWFKALHICAAPGMQPGDADGVKFTIGSKYFSAGVKTKFDAKNQKGEIEPATSLKIKF